MFGKLALLVLVMFISAADGFAQPDHYREIPIRSEPSFALHCRPLSGGYDVPPTFNEFYKGECERSVARLNISYETDRLLYWSAAGDCHMRVGVKAFRSDSDKRIRLIINNIYGGCRAGGSKAGWTIIEKPPAGYKVSIEEVRVDRVRGIIVDSPEFLFPAPLPVVTVERVQFRSVYFSDCLTLTGQSQWLLSSKEHLDRALETRANASRCREILSSMGIDLDRDTLVGVSFATGHCMRPELSLVLSKETSSDPQRNRYLLQATYDDAAAPCDVWTTHPFWLVTSKIDPGYRFAFDSRPRSRAGEPRRDQDDRVTEWEEQR